LRELHRLRGCSEISRGANVSVVDAYFDKALDVARRQVLAIACCRKPRPVLVRPRHVQRSHALVAPLYEWFSEGFETLDLKETKALLDGIAV
jgi:hypothetical protein